MLHLPLLLLSALPLQTPREPVWLDQGLSGTRVMILTCGEGALRAVFYQREVYPGPVDIILNLSHDHGLTWEPARNLSQWNADWISYSSSAAEQGILHLACNARIPGIGWRPWYFRSDDGGATWTRRSFPDTVDWRNGTRIAADGQDVVIQYYLGGEPVMRWSRDGGLTWGPRLGVGGTFNRPSKWLADLVVHDSSAYALVLTSLNAATIERDTFVAVSHGGGPWSIQRVDQDPGTTGDPGDGRLAVHGDDVQAYWIESGRSGIPNTDYRVYQRRSPDRGATWFPETVVSLPGASTDGLSSVRVGRDQESGQFLAVAWSHSLSGVGTWGVVRVSTDGGGSFQPQTTLPAGPYGVPSFSLRDCLVEGPVVTILGGDSSHLNSAGSRPVLHLSSDAGVTWTGGIPLGTFPAGFAGGSGGAGNPVSVLSEGSFHTVWRRYEYGAGGSGVRMVAQGIRLPFVEADLAGRNLVFRMSGIRSDLVGATARWSLSTVSGVSPHPENPGFHLDLGPSRLLSASLSPPGIAQLSATVTAPGFASTSPIGIPVSIPPGRVVLVQGWVNPGGLGRPPSDLGYFVTP